MTTATSAIRVDQRVDDLRSMIGEAAAVSDDPGLDGIDNSEPSFRLVEASRALHRAAVLLGDATAFRWVIPARGLGQSGTSPLVGSRRRAQGGPMGNRSKYVALTAAATGALLARRRRARVRAAARGIRDAIMPTHVDDGAIDTEVVGEGHAPGHRHLSPPVSAKESKARRWARPSSTLGVGGGRPYAHD